MRALIVYASKHGHTQRVAEHMAGVLRGAGAEASVFEVRDVPRDIAADLVIVAGLFPHKPRLSPKTLFPDGAQA
jgi:flavodoxin